jgi:hypothetical protein
VSDWLGDDATKSAGWVGEDAFPDIHRCGAFLTMTAQHHADFSYVGDGEKALDLVLETSESATIVLLTDDRNEILPDVVGNRHHFNYVPAAGQRSGAIVVLDNGLDSIVGITFSGEFGGLTSFPFEKLENCTIINVQGNANLPIAFVNLPGTALDIYINGCDIRGLLTDLPPIAERINLTPCPNVSGAISYLPETIESILMSSGESISPGTYAAPLIHLKEMALKFMGWSVEETDAFLLMISDEIHLDPDHYIENGIQLNIVGNGPPSGNHISPPESGQSNSDWQWDVVTQTHKALTGMAAIYAMEHNTGHIWVVTYSAGW